MGTNSRMCTTPPSSSFEGSETRGDIVVGPVIARMTGRAVEDGIGLAVIPGIVHADVRVNLEAGPVMIPEVGLATVLAPGDTAGPVTVHGVALGLARAAAPAIVPVIVLSVGMGAATVVILGIEQPLLLFRLCLLYLPRHTGDKSPNTHWAHCEHIESIGNM